MLDARHAELEEQTRDTIGAFASLPNEGLGAYLRVQACVAALVTLEQRWLDVNSDPYPPLFDMLRDIKQLPNSFREVFGHIVVHKDYPDAAHQHDNTRELFQTAWTAYSRETYQHSLQLMQRRLELNNFKQGYFAGKRCLDGGCGTGRFAIAMALAGAQEVIAADFGEESLAVLAQRKSEYAVSQVTPVKMDVTDLSRFDSGSFDFVASQGVLHHTPHPDRGIREHFRVTKPGGQFWLYLYGGGGIYWATYDALRDLLAGMEPRFIRSILETFRLREGLIYTFLDNFLAPRVYYDLESVLRLLRPLGSFQFAHMAGSSPIDDTQQLLTTRWGREVAGPDGEIRIVITKSSP